jgi:hypothetical protein
MFEYLKNCEEILFKMYSKKLGLFSYSSRMDGDRLVNDFSDPTALRYTINSLLGLWRWSTTSRVEYSVDELIDTFWNKYSAKVGNPGDAGLLLYLLVQADRSEAEQAYQRVMEHVRGLEQAVSLPLQEVAWLLVGTTAFEAKVKPTGETFSEKLYQIMVNRYVYPGSGWPMHTPGGFRSSFVSFGAVAYFLWALHEYWQLSKDEGALQLWKRGVEKVISMQQEDGAWPWFYHNRKPAVVDRYQIYSVHQSAMSFLFLIAGRDAGIEGAVPAMKRSVSWLFGDNVLGVRMLIDNPFFIYRSIRRREGFERARRLLRSWVQIATPVDLSRSRSTRLEVNMECRSYHLGWILFVWAGRDDLKQLFQD